MERTAPLWLPGEPIAFRKPARSVESVFIHCSASDAAAHDDVSVVRGWHLDNGWLDVGYHFFVNKSGAIQAGRSLEEVPAAQRGYNTGTVAVCLHGLRAERFTPAQLESLSLLCHAIARAYEPEPLRFRGHSEVSTKACPVFDYRAVLRLGPEGRLPAVRIPPQVALDALELFAKGWAVEVLQNFLNWNGDSVGADGVFGQQTAAAVRRFQRAAGLSIDGVVGPQTRAALTDGRLGAADHRKGDSGPGVRALQRLLRLHHYGVSADGQFGPLTGETLRRYQGDRGLRATGIFDRGTRGTMWQFPSELD